MFHGIKVMWYDFMGSIVKNSYLYDLIIAICIVVFFICISGIISKFFSKVVQRFLSRFENSQYYSEFVLKFSSVIKNLIIVLGMFLSLDFFHISPRYIDFIINILITFVNAHIFYTLIIMTNPIINIFHKKIDLGIRSWTSRLIKTFILILMLTNILSIWGVQVAPIIAGASVFGAGVAIAAKDFFENIIAGAVIITERKFKVGDKINIHGVATGVVKDIRVRSTEIIQDDKSPIYIPNSKIASNVLVNYSVMKTMRIIIEIGLVYGTTIEQIKNISNDIISFINKSDKFIHQPDHMTYVHLTEFAESSINLEVYCFANTGVLSELISIKELLNIEIMKIVSQHGADFAFPTRTIHVQNS